MKSTASIGCLLTEPEVLNSNKVIKNGARGSFLHTPVHIKVPHRPSVTYSRAQESRQMTPVHQNTNKDGAISFPNEMAPAILT